MDKKFIAIETLRKDDREAHKRWAHRVVVAKWTALRYIPPFLPQYIFGMEASFSNQPQKDLNFLGIPSLIMMADEKSRIVR